MGKLEVSLRALNVDQHEAPASTVHARIEITLPVQTLLGHQLQEFGADIIFLGELSV